MKKLCLALFALLLAACAAPSTPTAPPVEPAPATVAPTVEPQVDQPITPSFEAVTYEDPLGRFTLQYPDSWEIVDGESGARGDYVQIASWDPGPAGFESVPAGESVLQITIYQWDPKGDLAARLEMRRTAFSNSGISILEEDEVSFPGGPPAVRMMLESNGVSYPTYFFVLGEEYLEITGQGNLPLLHAVMQTFEYGN